MDFFYKNAAGRRISGSGSCAAARRMMLAVSAATSLLAITLTQAAERYSVYFEEIAETREQAYEAAVLSSTRDALANLVREENWNTNLLNCVEEWIRSELAPDYRYLVSNVVFDVDEQIRSQWALEGSLRVEMGFLNRWVQQQLRDGECGPAIQQRRTIYLEPLKVESIDDAQRVEQARNHVRQLFLRNGYEFVDESRRQSAQFRLLIDSATMSARGPVKTLNVSGTYVDNRVDDQPYLAINASVDERLRTTPLALDNALYERQAQSVLAQVREWEASHVVEERDVEIIFVSLRERRTAEDIQDALLAEIVQRLELPPEFEERVDASQVTMLDRGRLEVSILIPSKYGVSLNRSRMRTLRSVARDVLNYDVAASEVSGSATRITIFDSGVLDAAWEQEVWAYLDAGQLVYPDGRNALTTVQRRLAAQPDDKKALGFIDEIVNRLVQRALYKLGQGALASANSDLTLAESIGEQRSARPWEAARRELDAAIERQREQIQAQIDADRNEPPPGYITQPPILLFPDLESWATRAISIRQNKGLVGLTASVNGIKSIDVNGERVTFEPASAEQSRLMSIPGAVTQVFHLPPSLSGSHKELLVTATDGRDVSAHKRLIGGSGEFVVSSVSEPAGLTDTDPAVLKEGESALQGAYHALIIANQNYQRVGDLATPIRDAEALKRVLVASYSFDPNNVYTIIDGTRSEIELAIDELQDRVGPNDSLLIYFAGHGYQDLGHAGTGYWIPVDGKNPEEPGHRTSWISNGFVSDYVEKVKARHVLLISDSCYAGTFAQRGDLRGAFFATPEYIKRKAGMNSRRAITSGDVEPVLDGGGNGHSVFAYHLLQALESRQDPYLTAEQLFKSVFQPISSSAPQTPQYFVMSGSDQGGDFVFVRDL